MPELRGMVKERKKEDRQVDKGEEIEAKKTKTRGKEDIVRKKTKRSRKGRR